MALKYYALVNNNSLELTPVKVYEPPKRTVQPLLVPDAVEITLAQYNDATAGSVIAHRLADYRRRKFTLVMLPEANLVLDKILEEAGELGELL